MSGWDGLSALLDPDTVAAGDKPLDLKAGTERHSGAFTRHHLLGCRGADKRYRQCSLSQWSCGSDGWANVAASRFIFNRCITASDLWLFIEVNDTNSVRFSVSKAKLSDAAAPSVARPFPQWDFKSRHPTSTHGEHGSSAARVCKPTNPTNSPVANSSAAQNPHPRCSLSSSHRCAIPSLASRLSVAGKYCMTSGSALSMANGSRSLALH